MEKEKLVMKIGFFFYSGSDNSWIFRTGWTPQSESLTRNNYYTIGDSVDSQAR
jgi:hypothetical protein